MIDNPQGIDHEYTPQAIPDHAVAFADVLEVAARRIRAGQSVRDVIAAMCLDRVVLAVSGRI